MKTLDIVEALIYKIPNLRKVFMALNVINLERKISSNEHPEFKNILKNFNNPKIISVIGFTQMIMIIEPIKIGRVYPVIVIKGYNTEILEISKTLMLDKLNKHLKWKDYIPSPFIKKIIFINDYENKINGIIFSEYSPNKWTLDDPLKLPIGSSLKVSSRVILNELLSDIL